MQRKSFEKWLENIKGYKKSTIDTRISNCLKIEKTYGNLDDQYNKDGLKKILDELNTVNHDIPVEGNRDSATATYKSTLKLYLQFKENDTLDRIMNMDNIDPDKHDGSYELVREAVELLSKINVTNLGIEDLDMLYSMSVGTWKMSIDFKKNKIEDSNLKEEKLRMKSILEKVQTNADNHEYENREKDGPSIGMFRNRFFTYKGNTTDEEARKFISLIIRIKDLKNEEVMFDILEEGFKYGINGIQAGSASMMLHCLKPNVFPIITGKVAKSIVVLEGIGIVLNKPTQLIHYIENTKILKDFRDKLCNFKNYRTLDRALWEMDFGKIDKAWFVSGLVDKDDRTDEFIERGIWESGYNNTIDNSFTSMKVGDQIVIKSTLNRKHDLPFNNNDKNVSFMKIKAKGTIKEILEENQKLKVKWEIISPEIEWFLFTDTRNIWEVERDDENWIQVALLDFVFNGKPQDIKKFLKHPLWKGKYENIEDTPDLTKPLDFGGLHFSNERVLKSQISIALKSGKSIILIGPPGTGKSKIASKIVESYGADSKMVTAMSDWSSYDTIGGYKPDEDGKLYFEEGIFLSSFKSKEGLNKNQWLIIDEINRADIDKAFGPFFSALSGDSVELGLRDSEKRNIEIILEENIDVSIEVLESNSNQYIIPSDWRIIGTMNTFDKTSLYEMSYAFMRRFAFIPVAIPNNIDGALVKVFFNLWDIELDSGKCDEISKVWNIINGYRKIGPAIVEDIGNYIENGGDYTSAIVIYILPQFEGLFEDQIAAFVNELEGLEFINDNDRLVESIEDFFNMSLPGK